MITAMALVVPGSAFAEGLGYSLAYRIISGPYAGVVFYAPREVRPVLGSNVLVRFCPDDQFAREVSTTALSETLS